MAKHEAAKPLVEIAIMLHLSSSDSARPTCGPIANLLQQVEFVSASIRADFVLRQQDEPGIDLWNIPWQHMKKALFDISARARTKRFNISRTFHGEIHEIDSAIVNTVMHKFDEHEARVLRHVSTGAFWDEATRQTSLLATVHVLIVT